jgi:hypothetical protein
MFKSIATLLLCSLSAVSQAQHPDPHPTPTPTPTPPHSSSQVCKNWTAVHRSGVLTVKAACTVLVGAKLSLTAAVPQGINPSILILNLQIKQPIGMHSNAMFAKPVSFVKRTSMRYKSVSVDGNDVPVTNH